MPKKAKPQQSPRQSVQVNAHIDAVLAHKLRIKLAEKETTYKDWLEGQIRSYAGRVRLRLTDTET